MSRTYAHYKYYRDELKKKHPGYFKKYKRMLDDFVRPPRLKT